MFAFFLDGPPRLLAVMNLVPLDHKPNSVFPSTSREREREEENLVALRLYDEEMGRKMNGPSLHCSFAPATRPTVWFYIRLNWSITSGRLCFVREGFDAVAQRKREGEFGCKQYYDDYYYHGEEKAIERKRGERKKRG